MKIQTSYFANAKHIPAGVVRISICRKIPPWYKGFSYNALAPSSGILNQWKDESNENVYIERFQKEILDNLDAKKIYADLENICKGRNCVLLCYEKSSSFCHRHLVADWLNKELGIKVKEFSR